MSEALPQGWAETIFGDITINHDGKRVPVKASDRAARRGQYRYFGAQGVIDYIDDYLFDGTYLLIAEDGANLVSRIQPIAQIAKGRFWVNNHAHIVESVGGVSLKFLEYFLNGNPLAGAIRGTAQPKLNQAHLNRIRVPIPPTAEQDRIVAAIEEQFSRLDAGVAALERARQNLKRMRAAALSGLLQAEDGTPYPEVLLGDVLTSGRYGTSTKCSVSGQGLPVLRIPNVQSGKIDLSDLKYAIDVSVDLERTRVTEGDILIIRTNGSRSLIGRAAAVSNIPFPIAFASYLIQLRVDISSVIPQYLVAALAAPRMRSRLEQLAATTAGQYNISLDKLRSLRIPLPSLSRQRQALSTAEGLLSMADHIDSEVEITLMRSNQLCSAILARAFVGGLVPQDPTDEPAAILLEQIAAESALSNGRRPKRSGKARVEREKVSA